MKKKILSEPYCCGLNVHESVLSASQWWTSTPATASAVGPGEEDLRQCTRRQAANGFYLQTTICSFPVTKI